MQFPSLEGQGAIAIDLETCDPELKSRGSGAHRGSYIAGIAVGTEAGFRKYYPIAHENDPDNLDKGAVLGWLKEQLKWPVPKIGANLLYDLGFLSEVNIKPAGPFYDIQVAEPLLDENRFVYNLDSLGKDYLGEGKKDEALEDFIKKNISKKDPKSFIYRAPSRIAGPYAIGDVDLPLRIFAKQKIKLEQENLWDLFILESKLIPMLLAMRQRGIRVDLAAAESMLGRMTTQQSEIEAEIKRQSGIEPQIWAADNLSKIFDYLNIKYPLTAKTKKPSFTAAWLEIQEHPIAKMIIEARRLDKMRGTFLQGCILDGHYNGRIHCQFNQLKSDDGGAVSGRFSSSKPNLQFIPVRTDEGKLMRAMFLADEGQLFWKEDYNQIEYRLIAHDAAASKFPGAQSVVDEYTNNPLADFHQIVAKMVFGEGASKQDRTKAKTINFGLAYGEGVDKLSHQLNMTKAEAETLLEEYHRRAPFIRPLSKGCMSLAAKEGVITTILGRKRRFNSWSIRKRQPDGSVKNVILRQRVAGAQRAFTHKALNARTQGSAADIMKKAMVDTWESGVCDVLGAPQLTVHDELCGSAPDTKVGREAVEELRQVMQNTIKLLVPLKVDGGVGPNWRDASQEPLGSPVPSAGRGGGFPDK